MRIGLQNAVPPALAVAVQPQHLRDFSGFLAAASLLHIAVRSLVAAEELCKHIFFL